MINFANKKTAKRLLWLVIIAFSSVQYKCLGSDTVTFYFSAINGAKAESWILENPIKQYNKKYNRESLNNLDFINLSKDIKKFLTEDKMLKLNSSIKDKNSYIKEGYLNFKYNCDRGKEGCIYPFNREEKLYDFLERCEGKNADKNKVFFFEFCFNGKEKKSASNPVTEKKDTFLKNKNNSNCLTILEGEYCGLVIFFVFFFALTIMFFMFMYFAGKNLSKSQADLSEEISRQNRNSIKGLMSDLADILKSNFKNLL